MPQSALASSGRSGRSRPTHWASPLGEGGQVINFGEEQFEDRRSIRLVVADDQVDRWGISSDRTAGHGPRKKIAWVGGQQCYSARRRDYGHRMGNVVHFMIRNDIQAGPLQVILDHNARGRGRLRWYDECFAHDLSQLDGVMRGKAMVAGDDDDETAP